MHPLPRRYDDLALDVDGLPQASYFRQARNGLPLRMAVLIDRLATTAIHPETLLGREVAGSAAAVPAGKAGSKP